MRALAIAVVLAWSATAAAQLPPDAAASGSDAAGYFARGRELAKQGRYAEAYEQFSRSYELDAGFGTAMNLADCLEHLGRLREAWQLFDQVAREERAVQSRIKLARERADALLAKLTTLVIRLREPALAGLTIQLGPRSLPPAAEIRDLVEPGELPLAAQAPGHLPFRTVVHAAAGTTVTVDIPALHLPPPPVLERRRSRVYLAGGLGGAGAIGLGVSLGLALSARSIYNGAFDHDCQHTDAGTVCIDAGKAAIDRAAHRADLATGFAIGGAVLVGAAAAVLFTAPREAVRVSPIAGDHTLGLAIIRPF